MVGKRRGQKPETQNPCTPIGFCCIVQEPMQKVSASTGLRATPIGRLGTHLKVILNRDPF